MDALFGVGLIFILFTAVLGLAVFGFWLWMLIDCLARQKDDKLVWLLVIFCFNFIGALVYYFVARKKRGPEADAQRPPAPPAARPEPPPAPPPAAPAIDSHEPTLVFAAPAKVRLVATVGPLAGMTFPLTDQGAVIGRAATADIVVNDGLVSNRHVWVGLVAGKPVARDQGSTNGTYLNDFLNQPVAESNLQAGDTLVLGKHNAVKFQVVFE